MSKQTVTFELPDAILARFSQLCLDNDKVKNELFAEMVVRHIEDIEDGVAADLSLAELKDGAPTMTLDALMDKHGIHDLDH